MNTKYRACRKNLSQAEQLLTFRCLKNTTRRKIFSFRYCLPKGFTGEKTESKKCGKELCCRSEGN